MKTKRKIKEIAHVREAWKVYQEYVLDHNAKASKTQDRIIVTWRQIASYLEIPLSTLDSWRNDKKNLRRDDILLFEEMESFMELQYLTHPSDLRSMFLLKCSMGYIEAYQKRQLDLQEKALDLQNDKSEGVVINLGKKL